jgi:hypothetical protein
VATEHSWQDNLGALFIHDGMAETIYSTSTVDVTISGTTAIDYWAQVPSTQQWLRATRNIVIPASANDNTPIPANDTQATSSPEAANDHSPVEPLSATGTDATSAAQ